MACVCKSQENCVNEFSSSTTWGPGIEIRVSGFFRKLLYLLTILLVLKNYIFKLELRKVGRQLPQPDSCLLVAYKLLKKAM